MKPQYSVVIPTLNEAQFLPRLLTSLTRQTNKQFEVIVVDGKSTDQTVRKARAFSAALPLRVVTAKRAGVSLQRNTGAQLANGEWLIFVDADSQLLPQCIERIDRFVARSSLRFFTTRFQTDSDNVFEMFIGVCMNCFIELAIIVRRPWAPGPMTVVAKREFTDIGGYNEQASYGEDHELSMDAQQKGIRFGVLREVLYTYSFRRFRKEGFVKVVWRNMISTYKVFTTNKGPSHIKGFQGGGEIFEP